MQSGLSLAAFWGGPYSKVWRSIASIYQGAAHLNLCYSQEELGHTPEPRGWGGVCVGENSDEMYSAGQVTVHISNRESSHASPSFRTILVRTIWLGVNQKQMCILFLLLTYWSGTSGQHHNNASLSLNLSAILSFILTENKQPCRMLTAGHAYLRDCLRPWASQCSIHVCVVPLFTEV